MPTPTNDVLNKIEASLQKGPPRGPAEEGEGTHIKKPLARPKGNQAPNPIAVQAAEEYKKREKDYQAACKEKDGKLNKKDKKGNKIQPLWVVLGFRKSSAEKSSTEKSKRGLFSVFSKSKKSSQSKIEK